MRDNKYLPAAVILDIEKEENEGAPLDTKDVQYLKRFVPQCYKHYLDEQIAGKLNGKLDD